MLINLTDNERIIVVTLLLELKQQIDERLEVPQPVEQAIENMVILQHVEAIIDKILMGDFLRGEKNG
ncbi:hypothetical protein [Dielma fastidiosa]|uniref:hypothetical protein n=1 Tax=Dielma fastidiosa TaxID=1034346 RepID=UPI000E49796E|nr:hypothetical protein [Dielma fastidiosa]RHN00867.1 hypothetical protein DWZ33_08530 [Dielma fastidiosa]